jgi:hypothetical protein
MGFHVVTLYWNVEESSEFEILKPEKLVFNV